MLVLVLVLDLCDNVRATAILLDVCERGWVDVAKWLVQRFGFRHPWEFVEPLGGALEAGNLELARWMVDTFDLVERVTRYKRSTRSLGLDLHSKACKSGNLDVIKWCFERFPQVDSSCSLITCIWGKSSNSVENCKYVRNHLAAFFHPGPLEFRYIRRPDVLKWMLSEFDTVPTGEMAENLARREGLEFVKFFVEGNLIVATPSLFLAACKDHNDDTQLVKWLSSRLELSKADLDNSFVTALAHSNTSIASWLEESHHILEQYQGATAARQLLVRVCERMPWYVGRKGGLEWLMRHVDFKCIHDSETEFVVSCVGDLLHNLKSTRGALILLQKFPMIPERARSEFLTLVLREIIQRESLPQVKGIVSLMRECGPDVFTKHYVAECLSGATKAVSSKTVKWLITHFQLEREHITADNNNILCKLLSWGEECCAEWLINKFHITFNEVLMLSSELYFVDLATWQMLVQVFPGITATHIKEKLLNLVSYSPVIAQFTLRHFPDVIMQDIVVFCDASGGRFSRCWLIDNNL
ncbi:hypothetical protein Pelo_18441 [Pelomyxa schiedti]|nr:hypothetical protein Pelo_18441 [Pelomyxa schiedti]